MGKTTVTLTGDEHRLLKALDKVVQKESELARAAEAAGRKTVGANMMVRKSYRDVDRAVDRHRNKVKQAAAAREKAVGASAVGQLAAFAGAWAAPVAAVHGLISALNELDNKRNAIAQKHLASERGLGSLAQLAMGDPIKLRRLVDAAKQTYAEGGAESMDAAARQIFSLASAGALKERAFFSQLYGVADDPAVMARAAATMQTSLGAKETGSMRDIVSKSFAASKFSPASAEMLLQAASRAGSGGRMLGMSDEDILSATAIMATATGSAEEGATTVSSLMTAMTKKGGFKGLSLGEAIRKLDSMGLSDPEMVNFLGRKEGLRAFSVLRENLPMMAEITREQNVAQESDLVGRILASRDTSDVISYARQRRMADARRELSEMQKGIARNRSERLMQDILSEHYKAGGNEWVGWGAEKVYRFGRWIGGDEAIPGYSDAVKKEEAANREAVAQLFEASENLKRAANQQEKTAAGGATLGRPDEDR